MPSRLRKVRKRRGSRSHGWGQSAGHRGAGSHGGFGKTGRHKHMWTYVLAHEPDYFGKHGFYRQRGKTPSINVGELNQLAEDLIARGKARKQEDSIFIDLNELGIKKLLGSGTVDKPLIVRVDAFSSHAEMKIRGGNGQIITE